MAVPFLVWFGFACKILGFKSMVGMVSMIGLLFGWIFAARWLMVHSFIVDATSQGG